MRAESANKELPPLVVAAAADVVPAVEEIKRAFEVETSAVVTISAGATGMLERQIREGAPFDLLISADMETVRRLAADGFVTSNSVAEYAQGSLALFPAPDAKPPLTNFENLGDPAYGKFRVAIANPSHAPYGKAAIQALERSGILDSLKPRLVYGENVRQALQFAESANAGAAIVAKSLLVAKKATFIEVPTKYYDPIVQGLGITTHARHSELAKHFCNLVHSTRGRQILARSGFQNP